jgi:hypothetical protein
MTALIQSKTSTSARMGRKQAAILAAITALTLGIGGADARDRKPDNLVPDGAPVDCVQLTSIRSSHIVDDKTIDFEMTGRKIYRNTLPYSCPGLASEDRFAYKTSLNQLCSVDIITVLYSFGGGLSQGPSCGLGKFQPMVKAK